MTQDIDRRNGPSYLIGVDTGGTYTDAAIIEISGHRVIATAKAVTTKGDLAVGVGEAITQALGKLPSEIAADAIGMVSVSTTLATNAVVEGHGSAVGLILVGFDALMVERTGIGKAFPEVPIVAITGGHNHNGDAVAQLDTPGLQDALRTIDSQVDAYAVASTFAVRNAAHEIEVRDLIVSITGKPVTISTELSTSLDAPRRALTAVLNARLIPRISGLIDAVQRAMANLQIHCPLMIVKGDGSLALAESVAMRPIETVLSGPAASLIGAKWLSGLEDFILSDMGGTTTDLGIVQNGRPRVKEEGAEVGGWRTMVRAIDIRTIGLGGDSEITVQPNGTMLVGPQRVTPISLLASRHPELLDLLQADLTDVDGGGSMHGKFVLLPFAAMNGNALPGLRSRELDTLALVTSTPKSLRSIATSLSAQRAIQTLQRKGLVQIASLTPSDASHVMGKQSNWSSSAASMATQLASRLRDMKQPTPERTLAFAREIWSETVRLTGLAILETASGIPLESNPLANAVCSGSGNLGLSDITIKPSVPVVAVGGPVRVYYEEVQRRIGCEVVFPEYCDVANAIGAATGVVAATAKVEVAGDGTGLFRVYAATRSEQFSNVTDALMFAHQQAELAARSAVETMGAHNPQCKTTVTKQYLPNSKSDSNLLQAIFTTEAIGRPDASH